MNRFKVLHPKCGQWFPNAPRVGHCSACCRTIFGLRAFDEHRRGGKCQALVDGEKQWWQDSRGYWHWGKRRDKTSYE